jgi:hypothetical protein
MNTTTATTVVPTAIDIADREQPGASGIAQPGGG